MKGHKISIFIAKDIKHAQQVKNKIHFIVINAINAAKIIRMISCPIVMFVRNAFTYMKNFTVIPVDYVSGKNSKNFTIIVKSREMQDVLCANNQYIT